MEILLSFGANIPSVKGTPQETICAAIETVKTRLGHVVAVSGLYQSTADTLPGQKDIPDFINACVKVAGGASPVETLKICQDIESRYGRKPAARWSARPLDIDIIASGNQVLPSKAVWQSLVENDDPAAFVEELTLPHPRMHIRPFVLAPLMDIAPNWVHPILKQSVSAIWARMQADDRALSVYKINTGE